MALTNGERQRRWLEKNRAVFNLRRRNKRKGLDLGKSEVQGDSKGMGTVDPKRTSIGGLRELVEESHEASGGVDVVRPAVFRDDRGVVITERAWNALQRLKEKAKRGGYELDDYVQ